MLHNSIKLNWTLEEIGWHIDEYGNLEEWDGITKMFFLIVEKDLSSYRYLIELIGATFNILLFIPLNLVN